jgi:hypothetical protein
MQQCVLDNEERRISFICSVHILGECHVVIEFVSVIVRTCPCAHASAGVHVALLYMYANTKGYIILGDYVCIHVHLHMYVRGYVCMCVCVCVCVRVCMCACVYVYMCACVRV